MGCFYMYMFIKCALWLMREPLELSCFPTGWLSALQIWEFFGFSPNAIVWISLNRQRKPHIQKQAKSYNLFDPYPVICSEMWEIQFCVDIHILKRNSQEELNLPYCKYMGQKINGKNLTADHSMARKFPWNLSRMAQSTGEWCIKSYS